MRVNLMTVTVTMLLAGMWTHDAAAQPGSVAAWASVRTTLLPATLSRDRRISAVASHRPAFDAPNRRRDQARLAARAARQDDERAGFVYARLGYGAIVGERLHRGESVGFGYRAERDSVGLDVSLSFQSSTPADPSSAVGTAWAGALPRLQLLYFLNPSEAASGYIGGGLSRGGMAFSRADPNLSSGTSRSSWHGHGLQGEVTAGYEYPRGSSIRIFVEANAVLPFYRFTSESYRLSGTAGTRTVDRRFGAAAVAVSVGLGWRR